jgi:hypothetical protein
MAIAACGGSTPASKLGYPESGLVLLSIKDGAPRGSASIGKDPVGVIVSDDGRMAYVADSAPGDVYAVNLPNLQVTWKQHVGGAPFGLLLHGGRLFVSLFSGAAVLELDPRTGVMMGTHQVPQGPAAMTVDASGRVVVAGTRGGGGARGGGRGGRAPPPPPSTAARLPPATASASPLSVAEYGRRTTSAPSWYRQATTIGLACRCRCSRSGSRPEQATRC